MNTRTGWASAEPGDTTGVVADLLKDWFGTAAGERGQGERGQFFSL